MYNTALFSVTSGAILYTFMKKNSWYSRNHSNYLKEIYDIIQYKNPFVMSEREWESYSTYMMEYHYRWTIYIQSFFTLSAQVLFFYLWGLFLQTDHREFVRIARVQVIFEVISHIYFHIPKIFLVLAWTVGIQKLLESLHVSFVSSLLEIS